MRVTCPVYPTYKSRVHKANVRSPVSGGAPYAAVDVNRQFCALFTVRCTHSPGDVVTGTTVRVVTTARTSVLRETWATGPVN